MSQGLASLLLTVGEVDEAINLLRDTIHVGETLDSRVVIARARNVLSMALLLAGRTARKPRQNRPWQSSSRWMTDAASDTPAPRSE